MMRAASTPTSPERALQPPLARRLVELHRSDPDAAQQLLRTVIGSLPLAAPHAAASAVAVLTAALEASATLEPDRAALALGIACSMVSPYPDSTPAPPRGDEPTAVGQLSAALARAGVDSAAAAFEGCHGLLAVLGAKETTRPAAASPRQSDARVSARARSRAGHTSTTAALAEWAAGVAPPDLPGPVRDAARGMIANIGALVVAAMRTPTLQRLAANLPSTSEGGLLVLGAARPRSADDAALLYGIAAHLEDFDDTHLGSVTHPGSCAVPAALALWPALRPTPEVLLAAVAVGAEVAIRLGERLEPALRRGWHLSALVAPVAAAAVAGRLLGLDAGGLAAAMGAAATRASGITEALGTLTKPVHLGHGAGVGIRAALEASRGSTKPAAADPLGSLLAALGGEPEPPVDGAWRIEQNVVKPYACGVLGHSPVDLAVDLRRRMAGDEPHELVLRVSPLAVQAMGRMAPATELEAKFSLSHAVAVGFVRGKADPPDFAEPAIDDAAVRRIRERVRVVADVGQARFESRLSAVWASGQAELHAEEPLPLGAAGLRAKVHRLLDGAVGDAADTIAHLLLDGDLARFGELWHAVPGGHPLPESTSTTPSEALP